MFEAAGHKFKDTTKGCRCESPKTEWLMGGYTTVRCNVLWVDIAGVTEADIGKPGWAHTGNLSQAEYQQIRDVVQRKWLAGGRF